MEPPELAQIRKARAVGTKALDVLEAMVSDRNYDVRLNALEALAGCTVNLERHVRRGMRDRHELVRITALELAGEFCLNNLASDVVERFKSDRSELGRSAAAAALGEMGSVAARKVLEDKIRTAGEHERSRIYYALVKLGVRKYFAPFMKGLSHEDYRVRCATANLALLVVGNKTRATIVRLLKDALKRETTVAARSSFETVLKEISENGRKDARGKDRATSAA
jgi:hypothetical protein